MDSKSYLGIQNAQHLKLKFSIQYFWAVGNQSHRKQGCAGDRVSGVIGPILKPLPFLLSLMTKHRAPVTWPASRRGLWWMPTWGGVPLSPHVTLFLQPGA